MTIKLFEVGGSLRDELMGIDNPPDRDFCAESPEGWEALLAWCHTNMERVFLVTPEFFTVRGKMSNGTAIDIVMCRKDGPSSDGRHPDNVEPGTLLDDLARRDFTVNALAREVNPKTLEPIHITFFDPFEGFKDLENSALSCVGNAEERMKEDWLRLLRAARFIITKNLEPDGDLDLLLNTNDSWRSMINSVSAERIRGELTKMFKHNTVDTLEFLTNCCSASTLRILFTHTNIWLKPTLEKK